MGNTTTTYLPSGTTTIVIHTDNASGLNPARLITIELMRKILIKVPRSIFELHYNRNNKIQLQLPII